MPALQRFQSTTSGSHWGEKRRRHEAKRWERPAFRLLRYRRRNMRFVELVVKTET